MFVFVHAGWGGLIGLGGKRAVAEGGQGGRGEGVNLALRESGPASGTYDWPQLAMVDGAASLGGVADHCTLVNFIYG